MHTTDIHEIATRTPSVRAFSVANPQRHALRMTREH
jgi:hypothetical protein